jgi:hypothetical protein
MLFAYAPLVGPKNELDFGTYVVVSSLSGNFLRTPLGRSLLSGRTGSVCPQVALKSTCPEHRLVRYLRNKIAPLRIIGHGRPRKRRGLMHPSPRVSKRAPTRSLDRARINKTVPVHSWWQQLRDFRIGRLDLVDHDARPDVSVDRAPVRQHVHSLTGRMRFNCTDFQRPRAHRA